MRCIRKICDSVNIVDPQLGKRHNINEYDVEMENILFWKISDANISKDAETQYIAIICATSIICKSIEKVNSEITTLKKINPKRIEKKEVLKKINRFTKNTFYVII